MEKFNSLGTIKTSDDYAVFSVNPAIYPLQAVYHAAYMMMDKAFVLLDGNPVDEIVVEIRKKKDDQDIKRLIWEFNNELLNYAVYEHQSRKNREIKDALVQRALLANYPSLLERGGRVTINKTKNVAEEDEFD